MGIFEFINKKHNKTNEMDFAIKSDKKVEEKEMFISDLSFVELQSADWVKFAGVLKKEGVLSNSYDKNPISVEYSIAKDNSPIVELTFKSKTSDSIRKVQLLKDKAYLFVNGVIEAFPETQRNKDLNKLWQDFQNRIRYYYMLETNREGFAHARKGVRLLAEAEKMINMKDIYEREQEFLEKYKNVQFDEFCYSTLFEKDKNGLYNYACKLPKFIPLIETADGHFINGEPVIPFTPRTLEHCILHMTDGQKIEDGEFADEFEQKCRKLQEYSCFESEDWDRVIEQCKKVVRNKFLAYYYRFTKEENIPREQ